LPPVYHDGMSSSPRPFAVTLDFASGSLVPSRDVVVRKLSDMARFFEDQESVESLLRPGDDPVIYESQQADVPERPGNLAFLTTTIAPGTVGSEFYMTRGHHHVRDSGEVYLGMSGQGLMVMESRDGELACEALAPSLSVYVPPGWAHRTVNTGAVPLVFFAAYFAGAGHDYSMVENQGFSRRVHRGPSGPELRPPVLAGKPAGPQ
jgi:glucose-6-phosphate isomerase, archaeal